MDSVEPTTHQSQTQNWVWPAVAVVVLTATILLAWRLGWLGVFADRRQLVNWMRSQGAAGPLICIGIQFLQVVIFAIPGEITQVAAGYVFGAWWGFLYSIIGILLGSAADFGIARALGRPVVQRILGADRLADVDRRLRSRNGRLAMFVLFLLPGMPKDAMSYGAGLTAIRVHIFLALSVPARMPALLLSTLFGSHAYDGDYTAMVWTAVVAVVLLIIATVFVRRHRSYE